MALNSLLEKAWNWRTEAGILDRLGAVRVFHGPGEGQGELDGIALDRFGDHFWLTEWASDDQPIQKNFRSQIVSFLKKKGASSLVGLTRPGRGIAPECETIWGDPPSRLQVSEATGAKFWIRLKGVRHPGLFLDQEPLRRWLSETNVGPEILNTFSYTGSLSVAAVLGAKSKPGVQATTLDLSRPSLEWAEENFELNGISAKKHRFISGDVFEWLPRLKREKRKFNCIILDPPSFSRGKKGNFSTSKDLTRLHQLALEILAPDGYLITSINSANVSHQQFESDLLRSIQSKAGLPVKGRGDKFGYPRQSPFLVLKSIDLPETFPTGFPGKMGSRYLKGWILRSL